MRRALALLALAIVLAPACDKDKDNTKIIVTVWSDLAVPSELDSVRIDVMGPSQTGSKTFALTAGIESGKSRLPVQLELVPLAAKDATFKVTAAGMLAGAEIVAQAARVSFVPGKALLLNLLLARDCKPVACPADFTCAAGSCQPVAITALPPYEPGKPLLPPDAGVRADSSVALEAGATLDGQGEADLLTPRPTDTGSVDTATDAALDVPITSTGGAGGAGGGHDGPSGTGGAPGLDAPVIDAIAADSIDAPLGGAGGAPIDAGIGSTGGVTGTGGATATGGTGGGSGSGGATGTGGTGGSTTEKCVFGTSLFGNCTFGP